MSATEGAASWEAKVDGTAGEATRAAAVSIADARLSAVARLAATGVESPFVDARLLLQAAAGLDAAALAAAPERRLTTEEGARLEAFLLRRIAREPVSQILGRAGFWTIDLLVTPDVLTPRPETETVLEAALRETRGRDEGRVLDLGVGPGTLLLAFLAERPGWRGVGVDLSAAALEVAGANARALGLAERAALLQGDWDGPISPARGFDLVLSNPPYIPSGDIAALAPEVRDHEPRLALDGGADGLEAYRRIAQGLSGLLAPGGVAAFEVGVGQADIVAELMMRAVAGATARLAPDLSGRDRAVVIRRQGARLRAFRIRPKKGFVKPKRPSYGPA
jgi:release factor glutamine methyltransferase